MSSGRPGVCWLPAGQSHEQIESAKFIAIDRLMSGRTHETRGAKVEVLGKVLTAHLMAVELSIAREQ